jgi:hypothetical protein
MEKDVREGRVCSGVLFLERVQFMRGLKQGQVEFHGTSGWKAFEL